jgi:hypothetical protein
MLQPLPPGGIAIGWILFVFRDLTQKQVDDGHPELTISFSDAVSGKPHELHKQLGKFELFKTPGMPR